MSVVLLNSGGLDSLMVAQKLGPASTHVFVNVGQRYADKERVAAAAVAKRSRAQFQYMCGARIAMYEHHTGIIPFRNAEMILCAAQHGTDLYLGVLAHEINSDKSQEFMLAMEQVLNISHRTQYWTPGKNFWIHTPLRNMLKSEALAAYLRDGGTWDAVRETVSCYDGGDLHCGRCASCFKRWVAFVNCRAPFTMSSHFINDPALWRSPDEWRRTLVGYAPRRSEEIVMALAVAGIKL